MRFFLCFFAIGVLFGAPKGGKVLSGEVEFVESEKSLSIVQMSPSAEIEWEEFSISSGETVEFSLPSSDASVVNRIIGNSASQIEGMLKSNGSLCLLYLNGSLKNSGCIEAVQVELRTSADSSHVFAIDQSGIIQAKGTEEKEGKVLLFADRGSVEISGVITASDIEFKKGGEIEVLGESIFLRKGSELDASGDRGGGKILIGKRQEDTLQHARLVLTEEGATARADARFHGNGGTVVFFAEEENLFLGFASAQGGCMGGDGGFIDLKSPGTMRYLGRTSISAPLGQTGICSVDSPD